LKITSLNKIICLSLLIFLIFLVNCSPERKNIFSKTYHNTTSHYNAYFIAYEKIRELELDLAKQHQHNYNKVLKVFHDVDSSVIRSSKERLEDCIKKASIAIHRHKNSKWVDDSYIVIGKARYYMADFGNAIETFKFVNTKSKDKKARHEALNLLMRTFIDYGEFQNATAVYDYLKKEKLNKKNQKMFHLTRAHFFQAQEDYPSMIPHLEEAVKLVKKSEGRARLHYILGQIYQMQNDDALAYYHYHRCVKSNPTYELFFYARLNMGQVVAVTKNKSLKKFRKYFVKLLKDEKNKEYRDKIYYEMAEFEVKQDNLPLAIEHYNSSVRASVNNDRQKSYSYLKLGKIYYNQKKFELAKAYYDSTVNVMPKDEDIYKKTEERQLILADFVEQINTIQLQDSLLSLAAMDSASLHKFLDNYVAKKRKEEKEQRKLEAKKLARMSAGGGGGAQNTFGQQANSFAAGGGGEPGGTWYFYNNAVLSMGQSEFVRKWGKRELQDNWRVSSKQKGMVSKDGKKGKDGKEEEEPLSIEDMPSAYNKEDFLATVPLTQEAQTNSLAMVEEAMYKLGKIYYFELEEKPNAIETFETFLKRFTGSEHKPEILYLLYLILKDKENEQHLVYKDAVLNEFPHTIYAKLIINPKFKEESDAVKEELKLIYKKAYKLYKADELLSALSMVRNTLLDYEETDFHPYLKMLEIMIIGKTENVYAYQFALRDFIEKVDHKELNTYANNLLKASEKYLREEKERKTIVFNEDLEQNHNFILLYPASSRNSNDLPEKINKFISQHFQSKNLSSINLIFNKEKSIIIVKDFTDKNDAMEFYKIFNAQESPFRQMEGVDLTSFIVSKDNFQTLYQNKDINNYSKFFKKYYPIK
jgi:tetratricopeptide (TPR) repeat protein